MSRRPAGSALLGLFGLDEVPLGSQRPIGVVKPLPGAISTVRRGGAKSGGAIRR